MGIIVIIPIEIESPKTFFSFILFLLRTRKLLDNRKDSNS